MQLFINTNSITLLMRTPERLHNFNSLSLYVFTLDFLYRKGLRGSNSKDSLYSLSPLLCTNHDGTKLSLLFDDYIIPLDSLIIWTVYSQARVLHKFGFCPSKLGFGQDSGQSLVETG